MNLERHLIGSLITGAIIAAICTSAIWRLPANSYLYIIAVTVFFGILPDLNKYSAPQQWFYRLIFVGLVYFAYIGEFKLALSLSLISIIPLLSQGQIWMHSLWSAILVPMILVFLYSIFLKQGFSTWKILSIQINRKRKLS